MLITPTGTCKGMLCPEQMIKVHISDGMPDNGKRPSMETPFHLAMYRNKPEVNGVIHCHPLHCTMLAVIGRKLRPALTPEGLLMLGREVPIIEYATPGTKELAEVVEKGMKGSNCRHPAEAWRTSGRKGPYAGI